MGIVTAAEVLPVLKLARDTDSGGEILVGEELKLPSEASNASYSTSVPRNKEGYLIIAKIAKQSLII